MDILPLHPNFELPMRKTGKAGAYDLFMPEGGTIQKDLPEGVKVKLGFAATVPDNHLAYLYVRSGVGAIQGVNLNNQVGLIDPDYSNEWFVYLRLVNKLPFSWKSGDRLIQMVIAPVIYPTLDIVQTLEVSDRKGGFGSTGK